MRILGWFIGSLLVMLAAAVWLGWYMTFAAGALIALFRARRASGWLSFAAGSLSWGGPILFLSGPVAAAAFAARIGGAFGLSGSIAAGIVLLIPFLLGGLLAASGSWLVRAVFNLPAVAVIKQRKGVTHES